MKNVDHIHNEETHSIAVNIDNNLHDGPINKRKLERKLKRLQRKVARLERRILSKSMKIRELKDRMDGDEKDIKKMEKRFDDTIGLRNTS